MKIHKIVNIHINLISSLSVWVVEVPHHEALQILNCYFALPVSVHDLDIGCDVRGCGLEALVHGPVAVDQPLGDLHGLADSVPVRVVRLDYFPVWRMYYLARVLHYYLENRPPFSTGWGADMKGSDTCDWAMSGDCTWDVL